MMIDEQGRLDIMRALAEYYTEVDKVEEGFASLREIVLECRKIFGSLNCGCVIEDGYECPRCYMIGRIDDKVLEVT